MATDALVDVSYRGFVLGKRLRLLQVGPRSAYVACDVPMPVGTELILAVDETLTIPAQVARVREADSKDGPTGMWLWTDAAEARAQAWWSAHVSAADPHIPEPAGGRIRTEGPVAPPPEVTEEAPPPLAAAAPTPAEPAPTLAEAGALSAAEVGASAAAEAATSAAADAPAGPEIGAAAEPPAESPASTAADGEADRAVTAADARSDAAEQPYQAPGDADAGEDSGYRVEIGADDAGNDTGEEDPGAQEEPGADVASSGRGRRARGTEVMTAVELAEVLGTTPEAAAEAAAGTSDDGVAGDSEPAEPPRAVRRTQVMSAVEVDELLQASTEEPSRPEATAKGKSRNKRRRRR